VSNPWKKAIGKALPMAERTFLRDIGLRVTQEFEKPIIVNIGVFRCASMYCLRAGAPSAKIIGVDIEPCPVKIDSCLRAKFVIGDSRKVHPRVTEPVHALFIDGDHHFEIVKADLENWTPKVAPGGYLVLHDCRPLPKDLKKNPHIEGVNRAVSLWFRSASDWQEIQATNSLRAFRRVQ